MPELRAILAHNTFRGPKHKTRRKFRGTLGTQISEAWEGKIARRRRLANAGPSRQVGTRSPGKTDPLGQKRVFRARNATSTSARNWDLPEGRCNLRLVPTSEGMIGPTCISRRRVLIALVLAVSSVECSPSVIRAVLAIACETRTPSRWFAGVRQGRGRSSVCLGEQASDVAHD
ncbi:hypothetical protein PLICRDRAFT_224665 [Plicaturopsis crispa FD-325 SS-3]|nr:hypothetical protein PLICRDRAFT_224665 [Plicaturopsis crispa FD-325 SS-3]